MPGRVGCMPGRAGRLHAGEGRLHAGEGRLHDGMQVACWVGRLHAGEGRLHAQPSAGKKEGLPLILLDVGKVSIITGEQHVVLLPFL